MSNKYGFRKNETLCKRYVVCFWHSLFNFPIVVVGSSNISDWFLPKFIVIIFFEWKMEQNKKILCDSVPETYSITIW